MVCSALISCTNTKEQKDQEIDWSGKEINLSYTKEIVVPVNPLESESRYQLFNNEYLFLTYSFYQDMTLHFYHLQNDTLNYLGKITQKGDGPFEMPSMSYIHQLPNKDLFLTSSGYNPKCFILNDGNFSKATSLNLWNVVKFPSQESGTMVTEMLPLNDSRILVKVLGDVPYPFAYYNAGDSILSYFPYPFPETEKETSNAQKSMMCVGKIYKHPSKDKILNTYQGGTYACILDIDNQNIKQVRHIYNSIPQYVPDKDGANSHPKKSNKLGFSGIAVTEKHIYLKKYDFALEDITKEDVNNGYPLWFDNKIYVFDWEGNPVRKYNLDKYVSSFVVDDDDKFIYAQTINPANGMCTLIKYKLQ